jgi:hypothetical protein
VRDQRLELKKPKLHPNIDEAINFQPTHTVLEYTDSDEEIRLRIDRDLYNRLNALAANIPYTLRDREKEQQILECMEEVEYHESYSEFEDTVSIKDAETGRIESVEIRDDTYRV